MKAKNQSLVLIADERRQLTLESLAMRADMHPEVVKRFVEFGLITADQRRGGSLYFDAAAVPRLRMIRRLRESLGINLAGVEVILHMLDRMRVLQRDNASLRR